MGSREWDDWFPVWLLEDSLKAGFIFLSADHALLCPENGFDLVQDAKDLFAWIQTSLNLDIEKTGESLVKVDPGRLAVAGQSGGATMAFYAGLYAQPKPKAILVTYPMGGDLLSDPYVVPKTEPFFQFRSAAFPLLPSIEPYLPLLTATKASSPPTTSTATDASVYATPRATLNMWLFQSGTFLDVLTSVDGLGGKLAKLPWEEREEAVPEDARGLIPSLAVDESFPPTIFIHGVEDTCIRIHESEHLSAVLSKRGVENPLVRVPGADHGFDMPGNLGPKERALLDGAVPFLLKHMSL